MTDENAFRPVDFDPFVPASERVAPLPLTEAQAELWTATAMGREANCSYNQCFAFELRGPLRVESLRVALDGVVRRHEALRTVIAPDGASQTVQPPFAVELPLFDVSEFSADEREQELDRLLDVECETPFDLATGPLLRAFVLREGPDAHRFVLTAHHIVCDGWSSSVLFSDLGRLYEADCVGIPAQLGPAASYREHLAAEASDDARAAEEADEEYWAAQFDEGTPVLDLPVRTRPALKTFRSGREELRIDPELYAALKKTGARSGATLFATLVAAYDVLLSRLSGQSDLVVGIPFAGQPRLDNPDLVAHCVNTVPLRVRVEPDASFDDHLRRVGVDLAEAQEHALVTFGSLVRRLQLARDPARTPLVETTFAIDRIGAPFDFGDVEIVSVRTPRSFSNFEIQVNAVDSGSDLLFEWDYNADLFSQQTARRWLSHYETLLRAIVARSDAPVRVLPLLTQEERESLLSAPALSEQVEGTLHGRFFEQARRTPDAIALTCGDDSVSYGELARRARVLAGHLRTLGVGRDVLVGLRAERSNELVIGILGILAAGGAYLPLDPAYPRERVEFMLEDASVSVIVAERAFADDVVGDDRTVVLLEEVSDSSSDEAEVSVDADALAYCMYTSGSTGRPKGVLVTHANVLRLFSSTDAWFRFSEHDVWTLFHSYAFDFSVWELWGALLHGGRLVVVPYWVSRSPEEFRALLVDEGVTVLNQTPSAFRQLLQADVSAGAAANTDLRYVIFGGEALELQSLRPWFERHGEQQPQLVNMYGITETTVHVTYRPVTLRDLEDGAGSVIGTPIPDLRVVLLDDRGELAPAGVAAEMYVGGAGVSRGYLNRPELTAERFVPDPFAADAEAKLYRSGDLARRLDNGDLEYLGRIDDQVKLRGFRIELGEIEAALGDSPGVSECAVLLREDVPGDKRLVAYVVGGGDGLVEQLKGRLKSRLPEYMIPAHFVLLPTLPLTPNGKVDRKSLPAPDPEASAAGTPHVAPRTPTESEIAGIWADALGIASVGVHDDFFDLGGHSLMAAQIVTAIRTRFEVDAGLRHLLAEPTVAGLAETVDLLTGTADVAKHASGSGRGHQ